MNLTKEILSKSSKDIILKAFETALRSFSASDEKASDFENNINRLKNFFRSYTQEIKPEHIYKSAYLTFLQKYGLANIIKNYYMISELYQLGLLNSKRKILDLGSGPGTFALSYLLWVNEHPDLQNNSIDITMIDISKEFLNIFKSIWKILDSPNRRKINVRCFNELLKGQFLNLGDNPDIIVFSNSLTEMLRDHRVNKKLLIDNLIKSKATILIIDYDYYNTSNFIKDFTKKLKNYYKTVNSFECSRWDDFFHEVNLKNFKILDAQQLMNNKYDVKFLKTILIPEENSKDITWSEAARLVSKYKQAWENHDLRIIEELFSNNAVYKEKYNQEPYEGLENICKYWKENAIKQSKVKFEPLFFDKNKESLEVIWRCLFYRNDLAHWMNLQGIFKAKIDNGRIYYFCEKFNKKLTNKPLW